MSAPGSYVDVTRAFRPIEGDAPPTPGPWFTCRHCGTTFVGAVIGLTVRDEQNACVAHETACAFDMAVVQIRREVEQ